MSKLKKTDKDMGFRLKQARIEQKMTYEELAEKSGVSSRYIKEIENHGNVPSIGKLGQLIRALHISADPFFYPAAPTDNLDYQRLQVYLSQCTEEQITTILAIVEAYLRTYKNPTK
jgi:transcriptional regulator with XRE-family HTH domain